MKANYTAKKIKKLTEDAMGDLLAKERNAAFEMALDIAIMTFLLVAREDLGFGARRYGDKEPRMLWLMRQISERIDGGMEKHKGDLDMFLFDLKWRLKEHGIDYTVKFGERK